MAYAQESGFGVGVGTSSIEAEESGETSKGRSRRSGVRIEVVRIESEVGARSKS